MFFFRPIVFDGHLLNRWLNYWAQRRWHVTSYSNGWWHLTRSDQPSTAFGTFTEPSPDSIRLSAKVSLRITYYDENNTAQPNPAAGGYPTALRKSLYSYAYHEEGTGLGALVLSFILGALIALMPVRLPIIVVLLSIVVVLLFAAGVWLLLNGMNNGSALNHSTVHRPGAPYYILVDRTQLPNLSVDEIQDKLKDAGATIGTISTISHDKHTVYASVRSAQMNDEKMQAFLADSLGVAGAVRVTSMYLYGVMFIGM